MSNSSTLLANVCADLKSDWAQVELQLKEAMSLEPSAGKLERSHIAVSLQRAYQSFENLLRRVEKALGSEERVGEDWHRALLADAAHAIPGRRAAVYPAAAEEDWQALRAFRHFFIHGSVVLVDLDEQRLADNRERLSRAIALTRPSIRSLVDALLG